MDLRWLLLATLVIGVIGFFIGRRTAPTGRALYRLQSEIDAKQVELGQARSQMQSFLAEMQGELDRVSLAYRDLQSTLNLGVERLAPTKARPMPVAAKSTALTVGDSRAEQRKDEPWLAAADSSRLAGSWGGLGGPSLATATACPVPEVSVPEAPKDYSVSRRGAGYDEHSYA